MHLDRPPGDEVFEETTPPASSDKVPSCDRHRREQHENAILTVVDRASPMRFLGATRFLGTSSTRKPSSPSVIRFLGVACWKYALEAIIKWLLLYFFVHDNCLLFML